MSKMNQNRIQELINAYGADTYRWPETERQAGQAWMVDFPDKSQKLLAEADALDQFLDAAHTPASEISFLQARILKAAQNTPQDGILAVTTANDGTLMPAKANMLASWKSVAATLILTTGIGFGIGQAATADTNYASAEALLSISMQSDYDEADLYGGGL